MATSLNSGFTNNINTIQVRVNGTHSHRLTDRAIDVTGDGIKEGTTVTHVSGHAVGTNSAPGGKTRTTYTVATGAARTVISEITETDGGVSDDFNVSEFTEGGN